MIIRINEIHLPMMYKYLQLLNIGYLYPIFIANEMIEMKIDEEIDLNNFYDFVNNQ